MARWTGHQHIDDVLGAAEAWRERCFLQDGSLFSDESLWTHENIQDLKQRYVDNPIEGAQRDFYDKLQEQIEGASPEVVRLTAEVAWFQILFPHHTSFGPETKLNQIRTVWEWSGSPLPESPYLETSCLMGVGHPGTAYLTRRFEQYDFFLEVMDRWKGLGQTDRDRLMTDNVPWTFVEWLDDIPHSDRRPVRNAILYFLFPDSLERNISNSHRKQIVYALKDKIPEDLRPSSRNPSLLECDQAILALRRVFENELGTTELDFYLPPIHEQWWIKLRDDARRQIGSELKQVLSSYGLELRQCGSKKKTLADCHDVNTTTGFWEKPSEATNKPLRWILHFKLENNEVVANLADQDGSRRIAFANTAQGNSGALTSRIIPAIQLGDGNYAFYETWEWILLHCFLPSLPAGSSGQLFDDFDPETGILRYMDQEQNYIAAALITLNEDGDVFVSPELPRPIRYGEATEALTRLINVKQTLTEE